jgi:hypothetical protein
MSAADALRPLWLAGLVDCKGARKVTTESFLRPEIACINSKPVPGKFTLYVSNQTKIAEFYSHEADRFSSAAFESLLVETPRHAYPRSIGWLLIRGYYSAFFALHSLMRLHGWACTRLTKEIGLRLNQDAKLFFPDGDQIQGGLYLIKAENRSSELSCESLSLNSGGTHEALWALLFDFMAELTNVTLEQSVDEESSQELVAAVSQFRTLVNKYNGPVWLTRVRNRVNYSHEYGAWHPYERSTCDADRVISTLGRWREEPSQVLSNGTTDELIEYCEACAFLVSLCRTTMVDLVYRSKANSPFRLSSGKLLS